MGVGVVKIWIYFSLSLSDLTDNKVMFPQVKSVLP